MVSSVVTTKGQIVIPAKLRRMFGIRIETKIQFTVEEDGIKIVPLTVETIDNNEGILKTKGKLLKKLMIEKKYERELWVEWTSMF